jgi:hypothetical protein
MPRKKTKPTTLTMRLVASLKKKQAQIAKIRDELLEPQNTADELHSDADYAHDDLGRVIDTLSRLQ